MPSSRVFLVEPDPWLRSLLAEVLADAGHEVVPCDSLVDIWARADGPPREVAVVDHARVQHVHDDDRRHLGLLHDVVPLVLLSDPNTVREWGVGSTAGVTVLPKTCNLNDVVTAVEAAGSTAPFYVRRLTRQGQTRGC